MYTHVYATVDQEKLHNARDCDESGKYFSILDKHNVV